MSQEILHEFTDKEISGPKGASGYPEMYERPQGIQHPVSRKDSGEPTQASRKSGSRIRNHH